MEGWRVLERLKNDITMRHIPISIISTDESRKRAIDSGALSFVTKPIQSSDILDQMFTRLTAFSQKTRKNILIVEPDVKVSESITENIDADDLEITQVKTAKAAIKLLEKGKADCVILSPKVHEVATHLSAMAEKEEDGAPQSVHQRMPVIVYSDNDGDKESDNDYVWKRLGDAYPVRKVQSLNRLLDVVTLQLHRDVEVLKKSQRSKITDLYEVGKVLVGKKVLVVDDDARNIFALTSILEEYQMNILSADSGREAINILQKESDVDIVLMDIMMPEMDGMETIKEIRKFSHFKNLPIVAVTAKAMKGDREKCIEAGAWDYLSKPVDMEQLVTVLRSWLYR